MTIETIIRPFATPQVTPPTVVPFGVPTKVEAVVRVFAGRIGSTKSFHVNFSSSVTVYNVKQPKETQQQ